MATKIAAFICGIQCHLSGFGIAAKAVSNYKMVRNLVLMYALYIKLATVVGFNACVQCAFYFVRILITPSHGELVGSPGSVISPLWPARLFLFPF